MSTTFRRARTGLYVPRGGGTPPASYADAVLAEGSLLAYWRQGESSGTVMADSSPNGRDGIYRTTKSATTGLLSGDPNGASIISGDSGAATFLNVSAITVECLIQTPSSVSGNQGVFTRFGAGGSCWIMWINVSGQIAWRAYNTSGSQVDLAWSTAPTGSTIYHVAATYQSGQARLYVNGTQVDASTALTGSPQTSATQDAETMAYQGGSFNFTGVGDEFAIYSSELSAATIAAHVALI